MQVRTNYDALTAPSRPCWGITDQASLQSLLAAIRTCDDPASVTTALKDCVLQSSARKSYTVALYLSIDWSTLRVYRTFKMFYFYFPNKPQAHADMGLVACRPRQPKEPSRARCAIGSVVVTKATMYPENKDTVGE
jgi:hypothetical protein